MDALECYVDIVPWKSKIQSWYMNLFFTQWLFSTVYLRIDHDQEFVLCIFVQDLLKTYRVREHWKRTLDADNVYENNVIELFWLELKSRVNYAIKRVMIDITKQCEYDISDLVLKYCVSWAISFICKDAAEHLISSWTFRRIPGPLGCIPIENMLPAQRNWILPEPVIPTTPEAVRIYEELDGSLLENFLFGWDPLVMNEEAYQIRVARFLLLEPTSRLIFFYVLYGKKDT